MNPFSHLQGIQFCLKLYSLLSVSFWKPYSYWSVPVLETRKNIVSSHIWCAIVVIRNSNWGTFLRGSAFASPCLTCGHIINIQGRARVSLTLPTIACACLPACLPDCDLPRFLFAVRATCVACVDGVCFSTSLTSLAIHIRKGCSPRVSWSRQTPKSSYSQMPRSDLRTYLAL